MRLFLDCEWADLLETELVSIALVGEDGSSFFYAECEQLLHLRPYSCSRLSTRSWSVA